MLLCAALKKPWSIKARCPRITRALLPIVNQQCLVYKINLNVTCAMQVTVPLKSKLTLETRTSRLDPRCSKRSRIESRVSSLESRGSRNKAFSNMQKLERVSRKRFISRRKNNTVLLTPKVQTFCVDRYRMKTFNHTIAD